MGKMWCLFFGHKYFYMFANDRGRGVLACARCANCKVIV